MSTNVLLLGVFMTVTSFNRSNALSSTSLSDFSNRPNGEQPLNVHLGVVIAFAFIGFAMFFVPERPQQLASICEKHNSELACQVW